MSAAYIVHNLAGTSITIPLNNISQIIEANPYDKARGIHQYIQLINGTIYGGTTLLVTEGNRTMINREVGVASATGVTP